MAPSITTPIRRPTFTRVSFDEFLAKVDITAGENGDVPIGDIPLQPIVGIVLCDIFSWSKLGAKDTFFNDNYLTITVYSCRLLLEKSTEWSCPEFIIIAYRPK